jgi:hypothetical protein
MKGDRPLSTTGERHRQQRRRRCPAGANAAMTTTHPAATATVRFQEIFRISQPPGDHKRKDVKNLDSLIPC